MSIKNISKLNQYQIDKLDTLFFYDTETTGLPNWKVPSDDECQPHVVQLGAILCNAKTKEVLQELDIIIKPDGWTIPQVTIDVHGITNEHALEVGIPEKDVLSMFLEMRASADRVAYNKTFDQRIIRIGLKRFFDEEIQEKWAIKEDHHCAMRMAQSVLGGKNPKLVNAYKHFIGEEMKGAHDAMADTRGCMAVYFAVRDNPQVTGLSLDNTNAKDKIKTTGKSKGISELTTETALEVFESSEKLQPYLDKVKDEVLKFDHDLTTQAGRKRTASLAAKVAKVKVKLDGLGKDLVSDWKSKAKIVDQSRKFLRDELDELKVLARKPLTDWEDEQKEIEAKKVEEKRIEDLKIEVENCHEVAILYNDKIDRDAKDEVDRIEKARLDHEESLKKEAVTAERKKSEEREKLAKYQLEQAEKEKLAAIEQTKKDNLAALVREKQVKEQAEAKARQVEIDKIEASRLAEEQRLKAIEQAKKDEQARNKQIADKLAAEQAKKEADIEYKRAVHNQILVDLIAVGCDEEMSKSIIKAIASNKVKNVKITY